MLSLVFLLMGTKLDPPLNNTCINISMAIILISSFGLSFDLTNLSLGPGYGPTSWFGYLPAPQHVLGHAGDV